MSFPIGAGLLDCMVLAVVCHEDTYGYKITQEIRQAIDISESTLYPVLRRLQKEKFLITYDMEYLGRNRRYYKATPSGKKQMESYLQDWNAYKQQIESVLTGRATANE